MLMELMEVILRDVPVALGKNFSFFITVLYSWHVPSFCFFQSILQVIVG